MFFIFNIFLIFTLENLLQCIENYIARYLYDAQVPRRLLWTIMLKI